MENKIAKREYISGGKIKESPSLVALLQECGNDFEVVPTFSVVHRAVSFNDKTQSYEGVSEKIEENHVPMTVFEHEVGIPLRPKSSSSSSNWEITN